MQIDAHFGSDINDEDAWTKYSAQGGFHSYHHKT